MASPTMETMYAASPTSAPLFLLDYFFPGFSVLSNIILKYLKIDLNVYIPLLLFAGGVTLVWRYVSDYLWGQLEVYLMSVLEVRSDDEAYNFIMTWVASQKFAQRARRFVVNTNVKSRSHYIWRWHDDDDDDDDGNDPEKRAKQPISYTPNTGNHFFWYKRHLLVFSRSQNNDQFSPATKEEITISCFGRDPTVLKELFMEARDIYLTKDEEKTLIYRGTVRAGGFDPSWQRSMARSTRPLSTVILDEKVKKEIVDDMSDYLDPSTRRWYANRGIPYRRGYLLYGPPGTGKSSFSLALAGFFKMRIYIVSLSSVMATEENLANLFADLPRKCVVLLEDIDTAGVTRSRSENEVQSPVDGATSDSERSSRRAPRFEPETTSASRLSLSGLLNILDGVASQEGRILIMTTNYLEKLDKALIRPGRVDKIVKFDLADTAMLAALFRAIYAPLENDGDRHVGPDGKQLLTDSEEDVQTDEERKQMAEKTAKIDKLADEFAKKLPAMEFSPAEVQGFLMNNKRDPEGAVAKVESWVVETRKKKETELEEKRKEEEKLKEDEKRKAEEEREKEEKEKAADENSADKPKTEKEDGKTKSSRRHKGRRRRRYEEDSSSSSGSSSSDDDEEGDSKPKEKAGQNGSAKRNHSRKSGAKMVNGHKTDAPAEQESVPADAPVLVNGDGGDGRKHVRNGSDSAYETSL